jgi:hypothetical protein
MKRTIVTLTVVLTALVLAILLGTPKAQNFNSSAAIAAPAPVPMAVPMPNHCPNIHAAQDALRSAATELRDAKHDFCGNRKAALESVRAAIQALHNAESCAKCQ